jgi:hypothetical protein
MTHNEKFLMFILRPKKKSTTKYTTASRSPLLKSIELIKTGIENRERCGSRFRMTIFYLKLRNLRYYISGKEDTAERK